jgi:ribose transport system substrate-binding protein
VALVESSKFGQVQFSSFAELGQVAQILTDVQVDPSHVNEFRQHTRITVCGDKTTFSYTAIDADTSHYRIGYANLGEQRPFGVAVRRCLEEAAREARNIDLVTGDNQYDSRVALEVADDLIEAGVDLAVEFHFDDRIGSVLMNKFSRAGIPLISVDLAIIGATFFGVDNYRSGHDGGIALGKWIAKHWRSQVDRVVVIERPASGAVPATRIMGQLDGLQEVLGDIDPERRICLADEEGTPEKIEVQMTGVLTSLPANSRIAVIAFNDASVEGVIAAARNTGREKQVACVSQGAGTRLIRDQLRRGTIVVGAVLFPPQEYGKGLVDLATRILRRQPVPPAVHIEHALIDASTIDQVHPEP